MARPHTDSQCNPSVDLALRRVRSFCTFHFALFILHCLIPIPSLIRRATAPEGGLRSGEAGDGSAQRAAADIVEAELVRQLLPTRTRSGGQFARRIAARPLHPDLHHLGIRSYPDFPQTLAVELRHRNEHLPIAIAERLARFQATGVPKANDGTPAVLSRDDAGAPSMDGQPYPLEHTGVYTSCSIANLHCCGATDPLQAVVETPVVGSKQPSPAKEATNLAKMPHLDRRQDGVIGGIALRIPPILPDTACLRILEEPLHQSKLASQPPLLFLLRGSG